MGKSLWVFACLVFSLAPALTRAECEDVFGVDPKPIADLFAESFSSNLYEENSCGANVMRFVDLARQRGLSLKTGYILEIRNRGQTELDAIWGLQVRNEGTDRWMFHAVFEHAGQIYDFDFRNQPTPTPVPQYFAEMFLDKTRYPRRAVFFGDPLKDYVVRRIPVEQYLAYAAGQRGEVLPAAQSLKEFLEEISAP